MTQFIFPVNGSSVQLGGIDSALAGAVVAVTPVATDRIMSKVSSAVLDMAISSGTGWRLGRNALPPPLNRG